MPFYAQTGWDPKLICAQIGALQSLSYISLGFVLATFRTVFGTPLSLNQFFAYNTLNASTGIGWVTIIGTLINSLVSSILLVVIVERANKCADFTFTLHFIHFLICSAYGGFPSNWEWWILNGVGLAATAIVGEYLCMRRELMEISVSDFLSLRTSASTE